MPTAPDQLACGLGSRIVRLRTEKGLTQERLAWAAGFSSKGYLSRIENGLRLPSLEALTRIAGALEVEVRDLFIMPEHGAVDQAMEAVRKAGRAGALRVVRILPPA